MASRIYHQKFPNHGQPEMRFRRVKERFDTHSFVRNVSPVKQKYIMTENRQTDVLMSAIEEPTASQGHICKIYDRSKSSVQRVFKEHKWHAYHPQIVQELREGYFPQRIQFCQWALNKITEDQAFINNVIFTDGSTFHKCAIPNRHNYHHSR